MDQPIVHLKRTQENRSRAHIAELADHRWTSKDAVLYSVLQEGLPEPSAMGYMIYAFEDERLVFTQLVWLTVADRPAEVDTDALAGALARYGRRTTAARLGDGDYELGGVYVEQVSGWSLLLTSDDEGRR